MRDLGQLHEHQHGEHSHRHQHPGGDQTHIHGWVSPPWACNGDESFGLEADADPDHHLCEIELLQRAPQRLKVVMPYVAGLDFPACVLTVRRQAGIVYRQNVGGSQYDYWELTRRLWAMAEDFCYVEHDIMIPDHAIAQFEECPEIWCAHDYRLRQDALSIYDNYTKGMAFGAVRFRAPLMVKYPTLIEDHTFRRWTALDGQTVNALLARGEVCHRHRPDAEHLHDYSVAAHRMRQGIS